MVAALGDDAHVAEQRERYARPPRGPARGAGGATASASSTARPASTCGRPATSPAGTPSRTWPSWASWWRPGDFYGAGGRAVRTGRLHGDRRAGRGGGRAPRLRLTRRPDDERKGPGVRAPGPLRRVRVLADADGISRSGRPAAGRPPGEGAGRQAARSAGRRSAGGPPAAAVARRAGLRRTGGRRPPLRDRSPTALPRPCPRSAPPSRPSCRRSSPRAR